MEKMIITIGRQYGSGGREIGEKLAELLGYSYYDTLLIEKTAQESGLSKSIVERYDERLADKWMNLSLASTTGDVKQLPVPLKSVLSQFEAIYRIGQAGAAVIVGRCADYVLQDQKNVLSVFIHSDMKHRIARVAARNSISENEAKKRIRNTDKQRASYYNYYTDQQWGEADSYNLCLDSGLFGIDGAVALLQSCVQLFSK
ncbi:AAA family ATPase [Bianquea renquensis]|jgi:putative cytidylate kinase|uniref:Cytidylate kinase-like family protein n=1 Tax=Bianquea renquensis TaxID=2763661 RepID=A0A926DR11_9FIRM|nr:cytidylate kinase-like family protein [Bianquea renquensis]MBC8542217.1 cytidylate kinase-like family protein [Bianquea renquensis]